MSGEHFAAMERGAWSLLVMWQDVAWACRARQLARLVVAVFWRDVVKRVVLEQDVMERGRGALWIEVPPPGTAKLFQRNISRGPVSAKVGGEYITHWTVVRLSEDSNARDRKSNA
ncbi:hypothetical protein [Lysobacter tyrosinilyticus]